MTTHTDKAVGELEAPDQRPHVSGLVAQQVTGPDVEMAQHHVLEVPPCCPVSGNPRSGRLRISYRPDGWCLEVYALEKMIRSFVGGFDGAGPYPAERNMEGMIRLLVQMCADTVQVPVRARAELELDAGGMTLSVRAQPQDVTT